MPVLPSPPLPAGLQLRTGSWDDLDAVADLLAAASRSRIGAVTTRREDLRLRWLGLASLDAVTLVEDPAAVPSLVAYAAEDVLEDPFTGLLELHIDAQVHPAHVGRGAATFLLGRAARHAASAAADVGLPEATLRTSLVDGDAQARRFFDRRGFAAVRHLLELRLDLHAPPPRPTWPTGVTVRSVDASEDVHTIWRAHQAAFADVATHDPLDLDGFTATRLERNGAIDPSLSWLAEHDGEVVGFALCRAGTGVAEEDGWVRDLGVIPAWRRHGVGMALLRTAFAGFRSHGLTGVALEVDDVTLEGAVALYRRAGMRIVRRTDVLERTVEVEGR